MINDYLCTARKNKISEENIMHAVQIQFLVIFHLFTRQIYSVGVFPVHFKKDWIHYSLPAGSEDPAR